MNNYERYRFQDFPWLDKDFDQTMEFLKDEKDRELGLYLPEKGVDAEKLDSLLNLAESNGFMHALMLDKNDISDEGCKVLGEFLKRDKRLKYLFLENNNISNQGLEYLLDGLKENTTVKSFWVGRNQIDDDGVAKFSEHILQHKVIKEFSVGGSKMTDDGAFCIARALNSNDILSSVHLLDNNVQWDGARLIAEVISRHPSCKSVEIDSKEVPASDFSGILKNMALEEQKKAFENAVKNGEEGPWLRSKIMVVGQGRAGKTATVRSMLNLPFDDKLDSTIGAAISQSTTKKNQGGNAWEKDDAATNKNVDLAVDAASRLAVLKMRRQRNEQNEAFKKLSIEEMRKHFKAKKDEEQARIQKQKLAGAHVIPKEIQDEINQKFDATLITNKNTSLEDIAFTLWDYGGQKVFYTLHHLFLTKYGIYLLAFDMRDVICPNIPGDSEEDKKKILKKHRETKDYLEFWLNSVYMHASEAPILIIGTFLDYVRSPQYINEVDKFIQTILQDKFPQVVKNGSLNFFPLNNKNPLADITDLAQGTGGMGGVNIDTVRDTIEKVAREQDFVNQTLSLRWIKCLDKILSKDKDFVQFNDVQSEAKTCGINDVSEVENLLKFFHELGMIVHLDSTQNLREIVTTKPQWLITELSKVIRDSKLHKYDEADLKKRGLWDMYQLAVEESIVTKDWLEYLWPRERVEFLIDLMKRTMLISDWKFGDYADDTAFLVPSLIERENKDAVEVVKKYLVQFKDKDEVADEDIIKAMEKNKAHGPVSAMFNMLRFNRKKKTKMAEVLIGMDKIPHVPGVKSAEEDHVTDQKEEEDGEKAAEEEEPPKGFYSNEDPCSIVFDFTKSYLPNGVFQRLLCLCILKCTNDNQTHTPPELYKSFARIHMGGTGENNQVFEIFMNKSQILCKVKRDFLSSYKVLLSMMQKLKADVMGTGLEWEVYLEAVDPQDRTEEGVLHSFLPFEEVKEKCIAPWFDKEVTERDQDIITRQVGIELEEFLSDINAL